MRVMITETYTDTTRIFRAGRIYDVDEGTAEMLINGGFANGFGGQPETAAVEPPENAAERTRTPRKRKAN